jgi:organic hydroperoxide reductase OsmC/OhrA
MALHTATVAWQRGAAERFTDSRYSRGHEWRFDGGLALRASASPSVVPRFSDPAGIDPEEAFVASLASCHMLTFLHLAARAGHVVDSYEDTAEGELRRTPEGRVWVARVTLRPRVLLAAPAPAPAEAEALHHAAHDECFIANSVRTEVTCEPRDPAPRARHDRRSHT